MICTNFKHAIHCQVNKNHFLFLRYPLCWGSFVFFAWRNVCFWGKWKNVAAKDADQCLSFLCAILYISLCLRHTVILWVITKLYGQKKRDLKKALLPSGTVRDWPHVVWNQSWQGKRKKHKTLNKWIIFEKLIFLNLFWFFFDATSVIFK